MLRPISSLPLPKSATLELAKSGCLYVEDLPNARESTKYSGRALFQVPATVSALDLWQHELRLKHLTTFCDALDTLLDGGFQCGSITEICGAYGSGKTQICMQTSVVSHLPEECGGLNGRALYIDTRNGFSPARVQDMIRGCQKRFPHANLDADEILRGISVASPRTLDELQSIVFELKNHLDKDPKFRVIIIDSLSLPVQCCLGDGWHRTQFYFKIFDELQQITARCKIAVLVVNEFRSHIDTKGEIVYASAGGQLVAHRAHKRLVLARLNDSTFAARILKAATMPQISVMFQITEDGIAAGKSKAPYNPL